MKLLEEKIFQKSDNINFDETVDNHVGISRSVRCQLSSSQIWISEFTGKIDKKTIHHCIQGLKDKLISKLSQVVTFD